MTRKQGAAERRRRAKAKPSGPSRQADAVSATTPFPV